MPVHFNSTFPSNLTMVNVTIRVDVDCFLLLDGEYIEVDIKAKKLTKIQLPAGQHILEFLDIENPDIRVERVVDWSDTSQTYLIVIDELSDLITETNQEKAETLFQRGRDAYDDKDILTAVSCIKRAAEMGYNEAQLFLGWLYDCGEGIEQDNFEAVKWYRKAADQGNSTAMHNLGLCYLHGTGVEENDEEAVAWFHKSGRIDQQSHYHLGLCYYYGIGVEVNYKKAFWYFENASKMYTHGYSKDHNYIAATYWLGRCYKEGIGVEQSESYANYYYSQSAGAGDADAQYAYGMLLMEDADSSPYMLKTAIEWLQRAADKGHEEAIEKIKELKSKNNL